MIRYVLVLVVLLGASFALDSSWDGVMGVERTTAPAGLTVAPPQIGAFAAPDGAPRGLAFDGTYLWCANSGDGNSQYGVKVYKLDPMNGTVIGSYDVPGYGACGLAFDGTYVLFTSYGDATIWKMNPADFTVVSSIPNNISFCFDIAFDGSYIWGCEGNTTNIRKVDPATGAIVGTVVATYGSPNVRPFGLTYLPGELWTSDGGYGSNMVNEYDFGSASWVDQWGADPTTYPCGMAYDPSTGYVWVSCWDRDSIYVYAGPTAVDEEDVKAPDSRTLSVSSSLTDGRATLSYSLPCESHICLNLYDNSGRLVETLREGAVPAGSYVTDLDLSSLRGGVYFVTLRTDHASNAAKIVLIR